MVTRCCRPGRLTDDIRRRFACAAGHTQSQTFEGVMTVVRASMAGRILAHLCRVIGTPLAPFTGSDVPVTHRVDPAPKGRGVRWEREYAFATGQKVIVRSTIDLGHNLGLVVVAEGVENNEVLERLRQLGCAFAVGAIVDHHNMPRRSHRLRDRPTYPLACTCHQDCSCHDAALSRRKSIDRSGGNDFIIHLE